MASGQKHPTTLKATAIAIAETSSQAEAARVLTLPPSTVKDWVQQYRNGEINDAELLDLKERLVTEYTTEAEAKMAETISKAVQLTCQEIDRYLARESEQPLKMAELRDLNVSAGILADKLLALRGQPSSVSARFSYSRSESFGANSIIIPLPDLQR
jgi:transposase-like protein